MVVCPVSLAHFKSEEFRRLGKYSDVSILVKGRIFKCHRMILAAASSYFDSMFCGNFKESYVNVFHLHDIDPESFEEVLRTIYSGELKITKDNIFNLLHISEFLSVQTILEPCFKFILENMHLVESVIEIFIWARTMNILPLIDPLLEHISQEFIRLSENTAFLQLSFDDLRAVLTRRSRVRRSRVRRSWESPIFRVDDLIVDALVRWLHYSYESRIDYFKILGAMIPSAELSIDYCEFIWKKYRLNHSTLEKWNGSKTESFFETYTMFSNGYSSNDDPLSTSFANYRYQSSANHSSIHLYFDTKIFSINKYKPDGFISCVKESNIRSKDIRSLITSSGLDYLYCLRESIDTYNSQSFSTYLSIDLSKLNSQNLCPPPVILESRGAFDERNKIIYFTSSGSESIERNRRYSEYYKAFTDEELGRVLYYNCEVDEWFSLPQMKMKGCRKREIQPVVCDNLVYFISLDGCVQAYDIRSSQCLELPCTRNYNSLSSLDCCCALDGKVYIGAGSRMEVFHPTANTWDLLKSFNMHCADPYPLKWKNYMVPYENKLWLFEEQYYEELYPEQNNFYEVWVRVIDPNTGKWLSPQKALSGETILAKCGFKQPSGLNDIEPLSVLNDIIVFKSN